jgi:hypothetical protein
MGDGSISNQVTSRRRRFSDLLLRTGWPTLLKWLAVCSSLDPSGELGARLWEHHFGNVLSRLDQIGLG